jgi:hypothetical protein
LTYPPYQRLAEALGEFGLQRQQYYIAAGEAACYRTGVARQADIHAWGRGADIVEEVFGDPTVLFPVLSQIRAHLAH